MFVDELIKITAKTSAYRIASIQVKYGMPQHDLLIIQQINKSSIKTKCSMNGYILNSEAKRIINIKGTMTEVRDIIVSDDTKETLHITLWREASNVETPTNSHVSLKDVTVQYNTFHKTPTISINIPHEIKVTLPEPQERDIIQGLVSDDFDVSKTTKFDSSFFWMTKI